MVDRLPQTTEVIALFGRGLTGKTSVAAAFSKRLKWPVRHCGELVKGVASELAVQPYALTDDVHSLIDHETRAWCGQGACRVAEGKFLDEVLAGLPAIRFVELVCGNEQRIRRLAERSGLSMHEAAKSLALRDGDDAALRQRLFPSPTAGVAGTLIIDTSTTTLSEVVELILA